MNLDSPARNPAAGASARAPGVIVPILDARPITGLCALRPGDTERLLILTDIERLMASPEMGLVQRPAVLH